MSGSAILTNNGLLKIASASPLDQLTITQIAIGDGVNPLDPNSTALVNEVYRDAASTPIRSTTYPNTLVFELNISPTTGGFTCREIGAFDTDGDLIAVGTLDELVKPTDGINYVARINVKLANAAQVDVFYDNQGAIDHSGLRNRDADNVHTANAIEGLEFDTVAEAVAYTKVDKLVGRRVWIGERGAYFKIVLTSSVTPDTLDVIESTVNPLYSFKEQHLTLQEISINRDVSVDSKFTLNSNLSNSSIVIKGVKTLTTSCDDISRDTERLTLAQANFSIGDLVLVEGVIGHENYTPSRFTDLKFVGEVREIDGLDIVLDSKIDFIATGVTVSKIPKIDVKIDGDLHSSNITLTNVRSLSYKGSCFGSVGSGAGQSFISVSSAKEIDIDVTFDNADAVLCLVNNNISSGEVNLNSFYSGGESVIGGVGASSKVYRANAIQNMTINGSFLNSKNVDSTIYAARNVTCNFNSYGGGANFFDAGDLTSNRLESVQFSECDRTILNGHMVESNDQCAEMLACTESKISGYYANSKSTTSTEGAVVVKGAGADVTVDATVKGYGSRGVKFELFDGGIGFKTTQNSDIRSDTIEAIGVRDAATPYDCRCQIRGSFSGVGSTIIDVRENSDGVTVDATVNMANATAGVAMASSDWNVSVHGINTQVNKQLLSIANSATDFNVVSVSGEHDDVYMQYNGDSRNLFEMTHLNGLKGIAEFGGVPQQFVMRGGEAYSNTIPTVGNFIAGDSYKRLSFNTPAGDETLFGGTYRRVEEGRSFDGSSWVQKFSLYSV